MQSNYTVFGEFEYGFVQYVRHVESGEPIALLRSRETSELFYLHQGEYEQIRAPEKSDLLPDTTTAPREISPRPNAPSSPNATADNQQGTVPPGTLSPAVTRQSSNNEKISLFRSLFKGRSDVYAHGFLSRKTGEIGYSPVCANKGNRNVCRLGRGVKCRDCEHRSFVSLDDNTLLEHFRGRSERYEDVVGIYVLRDDMTTSVLVADFDESDWITATRAYRDAARSFELFPAVERSRSGKGAHVWLFFEEPIDAQTARDLGFAIITSAMRATGTMSFSSYDRLFPTQNTVQPGGLGNLIALPLQGRAGAQGNSLFIDDEFRAFPDQFAYLSTVQKATKDQVRKALDRSTEQDCIRTATIELANHPQRATTRVARNSRTEQPNLASPQTPAIVTINKSNGLHVDTTGLPASLKDGIKRLAVFANPNFFRNQAMHRSVYGSPHYIWLYEENGNEITLPRGCETDLLGFLRNSNIRVDLVDQRPPSQHASVAFKGHLREDQQNALDALTLHECGILSAPTGFGKTVIGAALIAHRQVRTLIIVPRSALVDQWRNSLEKFLALDEELPVLLTKTGKPRKNQPSTAGHIGNSQHPANGFIDVATFQALTEPSDIPGARQAKDLVHAYDMIICDECHYCAAEKLQLILRSVEARYVYGLSATPKRTDGLERMIFMQCGPIRHTIDPKAQSASQHFQRLLQPRFTRIRIPDLEPNSPFNTVLDRLCEHSARNDLIVEDASCALAKGRTPLVITRRVEHAELLAGRLKALGHTVFLLTGAGSHKERRAALDAVQTHPGDKPFIIVATGSYIGEGFDEPRLDTLILATPAASETIVTQYSGRLHRERSGKSEVVVYDYVDATIPMLDQMYRKRLRTYRKLGYEVAASDESDMAAGTFIEASGCIKALESDISAATKSITIDAIYVNLRYVQLVLPSLATASSRGVAVSLLIKEPKNEESRRRAESVIKTLESIGCEARMAAAGHFGLAIFDEKTVWYGSLPLLAFGAQEDCSLRFESAEIARDLMEDHTNE